jgi:hypothetical protein
MDLHEWLVAKQNELSEAEKTQDPRERIELVNAIVAKYDGLADPHWITSERYAAWIRVQANREIRNGLRPDTEHARRAGR